MQPASESRTVLIATAIGIVILILFVLSLGAVIAIALVALVVQLLLRHASVHRHQPAL